MLREDKEPFEVVNLIRKSKTDPTKKHLGILMSNFEINEDQPPNTDLESRIFEFVGDEHSRCSNCGHHSSTQAILMGDYYDYKKERKIWLPKKIVRKQSFQFFRPMLTIQAFKEKYGNVEPQTIQQEYELSDDFWYRHVQSYIQKLIKEGKFEEAYLQALYTIVTTPASIRI